MPVPPSNPHDTQAVIAVLIAITMSIAVARWRTTLRVILIIVIALAIFGAIVGFEGLASAINHLHAHGHG
jgi:hypothetical protein